MKSKTILMTGLIAIMLMSGCAGGMRQDGVKQKVQDEFVFENIDKNADGNIDPQEFLLPSGSAERSPFRPSSQT